MVQRKGNVFVVILSILLVISVLAAGYFYLQTQSLKEIKKATPEAPGLGTGNNSLDYSSPDELISQTKLFCDNKDYKRVALNSLKGGNGNYQLINSSDISEPDDDLSYFGAVRSLCSVVVSNAIIEKKKVSETEWEYRFVFSPSSKSAYGIIFNNGWKFVLHKPMRL